MTRRILAALAALGLFAETLAAANRQVELTWEELGGFVVEKRISMVLPEGVKLQGEVLAVRPDSLVLDIRKSSDRKLYPVGQAEIPRWALSEVTLIRERNAVMRVIGGILGAIGSLTVFGRLAFAVDSAAVLVPGLILGVPLAAAGGYYLGKLADRYTTRILIRPGTKED